MTQQFTNDVTTTLQKFGFHPSGDGFFHSGLGVLLQFRESVAEAKSIQPSFFDMVVAVPDDSRDVDVNEGDGLHHEIIRINDLAGFLLHRAFGATCAELRQEKERLRELTDMYYDAEQEVGEANTYFKDAQTAMGNQVIAVREMPKPRFQPVLLA